MKKYTVNTKTTYTKNGEEKPLWNKVGQLRVMDDGKQFLELYMFPGTSFYVFEDKPKAPIMDTVDYGDKEVTVGIPEGKGIDVSEFTGAVNTDDIPF